MKPSKLTMLINHKSYSAKRKTIVHKQKELFLDSLQLWLIIIWNIISINSSFCYWFLMPNRLKLRLRRKSRQVSCRAAHGQSQRQRQRKTRQLQKALEGSSRRLLDILVFGGAQGLSLKFIMRHAPIRLISSHCACVCMGAGSFSVAVQVLDAQLKVAVCQGKGKDAQS